MVKFVEFDRFRMAYEDVGQGQPVLFIHGYPLNLDIWQPQFEALSTQARLIAPDLRGNGRSTSTAGSNSMELLASDCARLLDRLSIQKKVVVAGLSMGGYVTFAFHKLFPERIAGLILISTRSAADSAEVKANRDRSIEILETQGFQPVVESMLPRLITQHTYAHNPEFVTRLRQIMLHTSLEGLVGDLSGMKERSDSTDILKSIACPTLVIHGEQDAIVPLEEAANMQAAIPNSRLVVIPEAGHLPNMENPNRFNLAIQRFFEDNFS